MIEEYKILGVDIGASGIKGAVVDVRNGKLLTDRLRLETPQPATPKAVATTFAELIKLHHWSGPVGCGFPAIVKNGYAQSAANIDRAWVGKNIAKLLSKASNCKVKVLNDADAAGVAEIQFGRGAGKKGVVLMLTLGSGIGSALFLDGKLVPNTEFGHVFLHGKIAERYAANSIRKKMELSWDEWGTRLNDYLRHIERLISPDLIVLGGGVSKRFELYENFLTIQTPVKPAKLLNDAGSIGAAMYTYGFIGKGV